VIPGRDAALTGADDEQKSAIVCPLSVTGVCWSRGLYSVAR
jgi:hypothetical protein